MRASPGDEGVLAEGETNLYPGPDGGREGPLKTEEVTNQSSASWFPPCATATVKGSQAHSLHRRS